MANNPYMGNPLALGLGALSQGIGMAQQRRVALAAQQAERQRQAALDQSKIGLEKSQADQNTAAAEEAKARGGLITAQAGDVPFQQKLSVYKLISDNQSKLLDRLPALGEWAGTQGPGMQDFVGGLVKSFRTTGKLPPLESLLGGGSAMPDSVFGAPTGGNSGDLGLPTTPANMGSGNLGGPVASGPSPTGPTLPPFAQGMQRPATPAPFDINSYFGAPGAQAQRSPLAGLPMSAPDGPRVPAVASPLAGAPAQTTAAPQATAVPQASGNAPAPADSPYAPLFQMTPAQKLQQAQAGETEARTQQIKATLGDPFPFLKEIGKYQQPGAQAIATQKWNEAHGTNFGIPGKDFQGTYSLNSEEALKQLDQQSRIRARDTQTGLLVPEFKEKVRHNTADEGLTARGQDVTTRGQDITAGTARRGQDITAGTAANRLQFDQMTAPMKLQYSTLTKQAEDLDKQIQAAKSKIATAMSLPYATPGTEVFGKSMSPGSRRAFIATQQQIIDEATGKQKDIQGRLNVLTAPQQQDVTQGQSDTPAPAPKLQSFNPIGLLGATVNKDNAPGCADGVCKIAKAAGVPVPQTRNARDFEQQLPAKGWVQIPVSEASKNDIITSRGTGPSGRHVQWSLGNGGVLEADSRASGYSNKLAVGSAPLRDSSAKAWRYTGGQRTAATTQPSQSVSSSAKEQARALLGM